MRSKPVWFSRHAKNRMRRQKIAAAIVVNVIRSPEFEEQTIAGRTNRWRYFGRMMCRVTCQEERRRVVVVSVLFARRRGRDRR